ncbi:MAG: hypothetical protein ACJAZ2_001635, partial [Glaciecola sp.]
MNKKKFQIGHHIIRFTYLKIIKFAPLKIKKTIQMSETKTKIG